MVWAFLSSTTASIQSTERSVLSTLRLVDVQCQLLRLLVLDEKGRNEATPVWV